jgi:hypothetical protein
MPAAAGNAGVRTLNKATVTSPEKLLTLNKDHSVFLALAFVPDRFLQLEC